MNDKEREYVRKLESRIHNQRIALRENWMIVELRRNEYCGKLRPLKSKWWEYVTKLGAENKRLKNKLLSLTGKDFHI